MFLSPFSTTSATPRGHTVFPRSPSASPTDFISVSDGGSSDVGTSTSTTDDTSSPDEDWQPKPGFQKYIGIIIVVILVLISLALWMSIAKWPRRKLKGLRDYCCCRVRGDGDSAMTMEETLKPGEGPYMGSTAGRGGGRPLSKQVGFRVGEQDAAARQKERRARALREGLPQTHSEHKPSGKKKNSHAHSFSVTDIDPELGYMADWEIERKTG